MRVVCLCVCVETQHAHESVAFVTVSLVSTERLAGRRTDAQTQRHTPHAKEDERRHTTNTGIPSWR